MRFPHSYVIIIINPYYFSISRGSEKVGAPLALLPCLDTGTLRLFLLENAWDWGGRGERER